MPPLAAGVLVITPSAMKFDVLLAALLSSLLIAGGEKKIGTNLRGFSSEINLVYVSN